MQQERHNGSAATSRTGQGDSAESPWKRSRTALPGGREGACPPGERPLQGKHIVVGIGGGIAAFKAVVLVRELMRRGAQVRVAMTRSATKFIGPATLTGLTGTPPEGSPH